MKGLRSKSVVSARRKRLFHAGRRHDGLLAVESGPVEDLLNKLPTVARHDPKGVAHFISQSGAFEDDLEVTCILGRAFAIELAIRLESRGERDSSWKSPQA